MGGQEWEAIRVLSPLHEGGSLDVARSGTAPRTIARGSIGGYTVLTYLEEGFIRAAELAYAYLILCVIAEILTADPAPSDPNSGLQET